MSKTGRREGTEKRTWSGENRAIIHRGEDEIGNCVVPPLAADPVAQWSFMGFRGDQRFVNAIKFANYCCKRNIIELYIKNYCGFLK